MLENLVHEAGHFDKLEVQLGPSGEGVAGLFQGAVDGRGGEDGCGEEHHAGHGQAVPGEECGGLQVLGGLEEVSTDMTGGGISRGEDCR